jgi:large subunit ribosomal protein L9
MKKDVENLGKTGDVVSVKDGYARNYLIPKAFAIKATRSNMKIVEELQVNVARKANKAETSAKNTAKKLQDISVTATVKVGEDDKLFGAVTTQIIAELVAEKGVELDKHNILLDEPIKELGVFDVAVKVGAGIKAEVKVWVVKE